MSPEQTSIPPPAPTIPVVARAVLALVLAYLLTVWLFSLVVDIGRPVWVLGAQLPIAVSALGLLGLAAAMYAEVRAGRSFLSSAGRNGLRARLSRENLAWFATLCVLLIPFVDAFGYVKSSIPALNPYPWDDAFIRIEAWLHFGRQPWEWLALVFRGERSVRTLNYLYQPVFTFAVLATMLWHTARPISPAHRSRVLFGFMLVWIVPGNVLAVLFASVGPCFYGRFTGGPDPFAPLMAELHAYNADHGISSVWSQDALWAGYLDEAVPLGVSAMPSVHVGLATLVALAWHPTRLRSLAWAYLLITLIASVRLGWHYAIDGYVSIIVTAAMWWAMGNGWDQRWAKGTPARRRGRRAIVG